MTADQADTDPNLTRRGDLPTQAIARQVDGDFEALQVPFLAGLVRVPSDNPPGDCAPHAEHTARALEQLGFEVERHHVPQDRVATAGMISATNLVVRKRFGAGGPVVALNAHGDVVQPGAGWTTDPYGGEIRDGVIYGRGVAVSKSDISTYAFALRALERCNAPLHGAVELHVTYDEETGGRIGPGWLLEQGITRPDIVVCAGFTYAVMIAHNGCLHLEIDIAGQSAHAAWPETGSDALEAATAVMAALYRERELYFAEQSAIPGIGHPNLVIGTIAGGISTNVVPDRVRLTVDRRLLPEEDPDVVEARLRTVIADAAAALPLREVAVRRILLARPLVPNEGQAAVTAALQRHAERVLGEPIPALGMPLFTDARLYSEAGCATVLYGAGPRLLQDANGHRADERLVLADLRAATEIVACALADLLLSRDET
jgi:acetylornithine deacetylase/succinyl-diaminopimelate desuccinylase-like protein